MVIITVPHVNTKAATIRENSTAQNISMLQNVNNSCITNDCRDADRLSQGLRRSILVLSQIEGDCSRITQHQKQESVLLKYPSNELYFAKYSFIQVNFTALDDQEISLICVFKE